MRGDASGGDAIEYARRPSPSASGSTRLTHCPAWNSKTAPSARSNPNSRTLGESIRDLARRKSKVGGGGIVVGPAIAPWPGRVYGLGGTEEADAAGRR